MILTKFSALILVFFAVSPGYCYEKGIPELKTNKPIKTTSPEECEALCQEDDQCTAIKWYKGKCYLMGTVCKPNKKYDCWIKEVEDCPTSTTFPTPTTYETTATTSLNASYDYFHAVCDDIIQVYMDGIYTPPVGGARPWPNPYRWTAYTYVIPPRTQIIAVSCLDVKQRRRYLVGSFSNGAITNSADWKCNDVRESAWQKTEYDDSWWGNPIENAVNDGSDGYHYPGIDSSAKLIWTGSYVSTYPVGPDEMFCRFNYTDAVGPTSSAPNPTTESNLGCIIGYDKVTIINHLKVAVTGTVVMEACDNVPYTVSAGGSWTQPDCRGLCLVASITGVETGGVHCKSYHSSGTSYHEFFVEENPEGQSYICSSHDCE